jgi:hypothetical protein
MKIWEIWVDGVTGPIYESGESLEDALEKVAGGGVLQTAKEVEKPVFSNWLDVESGKSVYILPDFGRCRVERLKMLGYTIVDIAEPEGFVVDRADGVATSQLLEAIAQIEYAIPYIKNPDKKARVSQILDELQKIVL